jgi:hypothetical protein
MSQQQFISANNQSLLWKVINNTPQVIRYFEAAPPGEKEKWFQYIIGQIFNQYRGQNIPLKELNKRAIDVMLQQLTHTPSLTQSNSLTQSQPQSLMPSHTPSHTLAQPHTLAQSPSQSHSPSLMLKQRNPSIQDQFTRRQAEYESMVKKEVPTPTFTENVKDEAIVDLNSAVEAYKRNRNEDAGIIIPPPPANAPSANAVPAKTPSTEESVSITIEELPKKVVQWGDNTEHIFDNNYSVSLEKDIAEIKSQLKEILTLLRKPPADSS